LTPFAGCKAGQLGCFGSTDDNGLFGGHPRVKQPVGRRLSNLALKIVYNQSSRAVPTEGPILAQASQSGGKISLSFSPAKVLLANTTMCNLFGVKPHASVPVGVCCTASPFETSPDNGLSWQRTEMPTINSAGAVEVPTAGTAITTHLRYAWMDTPMCMLYDQEACTSAGTGAEACPEIGLPVVPFNVSLKNA
jgi:hypothetical protein